MKKITIFEAEDGTRFNTEDGCLKYERVLTQVSEIFSQVWRPINNQLFESGRKPVEHTQGTREILLNSMIPIFESEISAFKNQNIEWLYSYSISNIRGCPCLVNAINRIMSIDETDREWATPQACQNQGYI